MFSRFYWTVRPSQNYTIFVNIEKKIDFFFQFYAYIINEFYNNKD